MKRLLCLLMLLPLVACEPEPEVVDSLDRRKQRMNEVREHTKEVSEPDDGERWLKPATPEELASQERIEHMELPNEQP